MAWQHPHCNVTSVACPCEWPIPHVTPLIRKEYFINVPVQIALSTSFITLKPSCCYFTSPPPPLPLPPLVGIAPYFLLTSVSVTVCLFTNQMPKDKPFMMESYIFLNIFSWYICMLSNISAKVTNLCFNCHHFFWEIRVLLRWRYFLWLVCFLPS